MITSSRPLDYHAIDRCLGAFSSRPPGKGYSQLLSHKKTISLTAFAMLLPSGIRAMFNVQPWEEASMQKFDSQGSVFPRATYPKHSCTERMQDYIGPMQMPCGVNGR